MGHSVIFGNDGSVSVSSFPSLPDSRKQGISQRSNRNGAFFTSGWTHLFVQNILPERVEHGFEGLRPSRHDGVLDDTPVPLIPGLKQLPVLQLSGAQRKSCGHHETMNWY